jgi:DNA polymerase
MQKDTLSHRVDYGKLVVIGTEWKDCQKCEIGCEAHHHVLYEIGPKRNRTDMSVDVLFIGEGPGASENALGRPFVGEAGRLLREAIRQVQYKDEPLELVKSQRCAFTNLIACRPHDGKGGNRPPSLEEKENCRPRLQQVIQALAPKVVVCLGKEASQEFAYQSAHASTNYPSVREWRHLVHPSYIYRHEGSAYAESRRFKAFVSDMEDVFKRAAAL